MSISRYDGFVIWGHGLPYIEEIMEIIRSRFEIIIILRKEIDDVREFVDELYSLDTYPIELIREKTDYLLEEKHEAVFVLVRNDNVDLWDVDMGKYAKKECRYVAHTKVLIRERYNKHPHHHVVHGTDTERETNHILRMFGGMPIENYLINKDTPFPWHIAPFQYKETTVNLTKLRGRICCDYWTRKIMDTPHYLYAIGNKEPYTDYFYRHYGKELVEDHFPFKFDQMIDAYNKGCEFPPLLVKGDMLIDGGHRAAILLANNVHSYKAYKRVESVKAVRERKRILLIGGTGGIGQQLLSAFDEDKYEVTAVGSKDFDVTDEGEDIERFGNPEVVVVLAGMLDTYDLSEQSSSTWGMLGVNCFGAVNTLSKFIEAFRPRRYGTIVFMSSVFSDINIPSTGVYSATKAFVDKLVKVAAIENAEYGITVNSIQLGYAGVGMGLTDDDALNEQMRNKPLMKRFVSATEIANTIAYFIETQYITGQNIRLDGGIR